MKKLLAAAFIGAIALAETTTAPAPTMMKKKKMANATKSVVKNKKYAKHTPTTEAAPVNTAVKPEAAAPTKETAPSK